MGTIARISLLCLIFAACFQHSSGNILTQCDFDDARNSICDWTHANQTYRWRWSNSTTPSQHTGPTSDVTRNGLAGYLFIEASSRRLNDSCYIRSPLLNVTDGSGICVSFWAHMMGENMGAIKINIAEGVNASYSNIFTRRGDFDNYWTRVRVAYNLSASDFRVEVQGVTGKDHLGDAAIDQLIVETCALETETLVANATFPVVQNPTGPQRAALSLICSFEDNRCGFSQATDDDLDWFRVAGVRETEYTGPVVDNTLGSVTGLYMYVESSEPNRPGQTARLVSPIIRLTDYVTHRLCFEFFYFMYGDGMGNLRVTATPVNCTNQSAEAGRWPSCSEEVLDIRGDQGERWQRVQRNLSYEWEEFTIEFEATIGTFRSDTAIDDVSFYECDDGFIFPTKPQPDFLDGCTTPVTIKNETGSIYSDSKYPNGIYVPDSRCRWIIDATNDTKVLQLNYDYDFFVEASEHCDIDYVRVFDGLSNDQLGTFKPCGPSPFGFKGPFCGNHPPDTFVTRSNRAVVEFCSNGRNQRTGFHISWNQTEPIASVSSPSCPSDVNLRGEEKQFIKLPLSDLPYENNLRCQIRIKSENTTYPSIQINTGSFDVEDAKKCESDYLEIVESCTANLLPTRFCGNMGPVQFKSECRDVVLNFVSDSSDSGWGFEIVVHGAKCLAKKFSCGDACISQDNVCDGSKECSNGADEEPSMCHTLYSCGKELAVEALPTELGYQPNFTHPWHVAILSRTRRLSCSGSLIHPGWLITSAVCASRFRRLEDIVIRLDAVALNFKAWPSSVETSALKIILHPTFDENAMRGDIALIKFISPAELNTMRTPACLLLNDDDVAVNGTVGKVTGFYHVQSSVPLPTRIPALEPFSNVTVFSTTVDARVVDTSICNESAAFALDQNVLCIASDSGGACETSGDLGAPLVFLRKNRYHLAGIYSFSATECRHNYATPAPNIYTRIKSYTAWIFDILAQDAYNTNR